VPARGAALPTSALGEQNALFSTAVAARRRGERRAALAALDRLVATYPEGPLAESAAAERFRVLQAVDMERARAAARDYVARYPSGFARDEAEAVLAADR
jgi:outer membrane protein assembly factor BamD (BamD/ComL family)